MDKNIISILEDDKELLDKLFKIYNKKQNLNIIYILIIIIKNPSK